jgi:hypothetical protein
LKKLVAFFGLTYRVLSFIEVPLHCVGFPVLRERCSRLRSVNTIG